MPKKGQARIRCETCGKDIEWNGETRRWEHVREPKDAHEGKNPNQPQR